jgi:hypothetical protein
MAEKTYFKIQVDPKTFENPSFGFEDPLLGFEDPLLGYDAEAMKAALYKLERVAAAGSVRENAGILHIEANGIPAPIRVLLEAGEAKEQLLRHVAGGVVIRLGVANSRNWASGTASNPVMLNVNEARPRQG